MPVSAVERDLDLYKVNEQQNSCLLARRVMDTMCVQYLQVPLDPLIKYADGSTPCSVNSLSIHQM
jgi:hypothetical protein